MARRLTQETIEVPTKGSGTAVTRRLTQEVIEVPTKGSGTAVTRRLTQIVIEVAITQPVTVGPTDVRLIYPEWSPAYSQPPVEGQAITYASFFGPHAKIITLGGRRIWQGFLRR